MKNTMIKRVLALGMVCAVIMPFPGCKSDSSEVESKRKNNRKESQETITEPFIDTSNDWCDPEQFAGFLENELGAQKVDSKEISSDTWSKGFYMENPKSFTFEWLEYDGQKFLSSINRTFRSLKVPSYCSLNKHRKMEYDIPHSYMYLKYKASNQKISEHSIKEYYPGKETLSEIQYSQMTTGAHWLEFADQQQALIFFKAAVERDFVERASDYVRIMAEQMESDTLTDSVMPLTRPYKTLRNNNAKVGTRKLYTLEDLPSEIYQLDESEGKGYFIYCVKDKWAEIEDMFLDWKDPLYVSVYQVEKSYSIYLEGNKILFLFNSIIVEDNGCVDFYYEDWPEIPVSDDGYVKEFYKEFGLRSPYEFAIDEDLNRELTYTSDFQVFAIPEIFRRRADEK